MASASNRPASLGEALLKAGMIDTDQLNQALKEQAATAVSLGRILVEKGWINETVRLTILQKEFGFKLFRLERKKISPSILNLFPLAFAEKHHIVPVAESDEGALHVIMEDPSDEVILGAVRNQMGRPLTPMVASSRDIEAVLNQYMELKAEGVMPVAGEQAFMTPSITYRVLRSLFLPVLMFLPLVIFFAMLYIDAFDVAYQLQLAIERQYASTTDMVIYIALIWGIWALIAYEINSLLFNDKAPRKKKHFES